MASEGEGFTDLMRSLCKHLCQLTILEYLHIKVMLLRLLTHCERGSLSG